MENNKELDDIIPEPTKGEWSRCENCKHFAEAHNPVDDSENSKDTCEGDYEGDSCNCTEYKGKIIE